MYCSVGCGGGKVSRVGGVDLLPFVGGSGGGWFLWVLRSAGSVELLPSVLFWLSM